VETSNLLDKRLLAVANMVKPCNNAVDVGTDHGFIPIYLVSNNIVKHFIASDNKIGPLNKAKENIELCNLNDKIETVLSDGLDKITYPLDYVIIAGMGGHLISSILQKSNNKYPNLVLQANTHVEVLRETLVKLGYTIIDEEIVYESEKYYEVISASLKPSKLTDLEIKYGPINLKKKSPLFVKMYEDRIDVLKNILNELKEYSPAYNLKLNEINELKSIIK